MSYRQTGGTFFDLFDPQEFNKEQEDLGPSNGMLIANDPATGNTRTIDDVNRTAATFGTAISNIINAFKGTPQTPVMPVTAIGGGMDFTTIAMIGGIAVLGIFLLKKKKS